MAIVQWIEVIDENSLPLKKSEGNLDLVRLRLHRTKDNNGFLTSVAVYGLLLTGSPRRFILMMSRDFRENFLNQLFPEKV